MVRVHVASIRAGVVVVGVTINVEPGEQPLHPTAPARRTQRAL